MIDIGALFIIVVLVSLFGGMAYRSWKAERDYQRNPKNRGSYPS